MVLLYIKEDTTVGELKKYLAQVLDDAKIITPEQSNIRLEHFTEGDKHELYIKEI